MARYPGAVWKPITASKGRDRLTVYNRVNLHSTASTSSSQFGYFNQSGIPDSHFHVGYDGKVEQYVDTAWQAFADLEGNDATVSIETQGVSLSTGDEEWRPAQLLAIIKLVAWIMKTHDIPRKLATNSWAGSKTSQGLSWHRLGCDGNFPALPSIQAGRNQRGGGMRYTKHFGKVCPGYKRITQIHQDVWPGVQKILTGSSPTQEETMSLSETQAKQLSNVNHFATAEIVPDFDGNQTVVDALRRLLVLVRRILGQNLDAAVARGVKAALSSMPGVDEQAITAGVVAEVRKELDSVTDTKYVLTPEEQ